MGPHRREDEDAALSAVHLPLEILPQPDDVTCGPTCLHAVYRFFGESVALDELIRSTRSWDNHGVGRGTLAVMLGNHALSRGYQASLLTFDLQHFDPSWFGKDGRAKSDVLAEKLRAQALHKAEGDERFGLATDAYCEFLARGGAILFRDLTARWIGATLKRGLPVLTGVSATYLYHCPREYGPRDDYDDIRGSPSGHFVVLHGYDPLHRTVTVADPLGDNPTFDAHNYVVPLTRLVPAIMLGALTNDANLLVIEPSQGTSLETADRRRL